MKKIIFFHLTSLLYLRQKGKYVIIRDDTIQDRAVRIFYIYIYIKQYQDSVRKISPSQRKESYKIDKSEELFSFL